MKKESGIVLLLILGVIVLSISFIAAESVVAVSSVEFGNPPLMYPDSVQSFWCLNNILIIVAAVLLIIGAIFLIKRKKKAKKSKKKKQ